MTTSKFAPVEFPEDDVAYSGGFATVLLNELIELRNLAIDMRAENSSNAVIAFYSRVDSLQGQLNAHLTCFNEGKFFLKNACCIAPAVGMLLKARIDLYVHGTGLLAHAGDIFLVEKVFNVDEIYNGNGVALARCIKHLPELNEWDNCISIGEDGSEQYEITLSNFELIKKPEDCEDFPLEECPFCDSTEVRLVAEGDLTHVECTKCGAGGPCEDSSVQAVMKWNRRA